MRLLLILLCCVAVFWGQAQTRQELEKKRQSVARALSKTNQQLKATQRTRQSTQKQLSRLRQHLAAKTALLDSLQQLQTQVSTRQARQAMVAAALEVDLVQLRAQYRSVLRALHRRQQLRRTAPALARAHQGPLPKQLLYNSTIQTQRQHQIECVQLIQNDLAHSAHQLLHTRAQQDTLLEQLSEDQVHLTRDQRSKARKMARLRQQERRLRRTLAQQKKSKQVLSKKIEEAILRQIAAAKAAARRYQAQQKNTTTPNKQAAPARPNANRATQQFAAQKGRLISPIYHGKIVGRYGKRAHPTFKDVTINNNGIDLQGQYNSVVRNVYDGTVVSIFTVPGLNNAVMVKHGDYYTTYSNVAKVYVKQGQAIKTAAQIGTIGRDPKGKGHLLHFELWHNKRKENPLPWIRPKGRL